MPAISNAAFKKKLESAANRAGMSDAEAISFIQATTADSPYFADFIRRATAPGSTHVLPGAAAQGFDNWCKSLYAKNVGAGKKAARQVNDALATGAAQAVKQSQRKQEKARRRTAPKPPPAPAPPRRAEVAKPRAPKGWVFVETITYAGGPPTHVYRKGDRLIEGKPGARQADRAWNPILKIDMGYRRIKRAMVPLATVLREFKVEDAEDAAKVRKRAQTKPARKPTAASKPRRSTVTTPKKPKPQEAAARAVVNETVKSAVARARRRGIKGPLKVTFDLKVERL